MRTRLRFRGEIVPASSVHLGDLVVIEQGQSDLLAIRVTIGHTNYALVLSQLGEDSPRPTPYLVVFDALAADTTPVRRGGAGLGLAIAHELAQAHGGELILVETSEAGTVFELTLPEAGRVA